VTRLSSLAVAALALGVVAAVATAFVPTCAPAGAAAAILGAVALVRMREGRAARDGAAPRPRPRGRMLALAGVVLGLASAGFAARTLVVWHRLVREPILAGPRDALLAGLAGDLAGFQGAFTGAGAEVDPAAAQAFIDELRRRYGGLLALTQGIDDRPELAAGDIDHADVRAPYLARFDRADVVIEASYAAFRRGALVARWNWIHVRDPDLGDLIYPPGAAVSDEGVPDETRDTDERAEDPG
jgi:hypothetical protein